MHKTITLSMTDVELATLIASAVEAGLKAALHGTREEQQTELLTRRQLARRLQVSTAHVSKLVERGLPCLGKGREKRFRLSECEQWLKNGEQSMSL